MVASIPFRFKAGGGGIGSGAEAHHHRSTTKTSNKAFKSRHATKGLLKDLSKGKVEGEHGKRNTKSLHQQVMSKIERRHQARQKQQTKHQEHTKSIGLFSGQNGAPKIVAVVPLTSDADSRAAVQKLSKSLDLEVEMPAEGQVTVRIERFKQSIEYLPTQRQLLNALDSCRVADFVIFILSPTQEVDQTGQLLLKAIESQGVSNVLTVVQHLDNFEPAKRRPQVVTSLKSYISHYFPDQEKVHSLDSPQECANVIRSLCTTTPRGIRWREDRSWMLIDDVQWPEQSLTQHNPTGVVVLTGVVRGRPLKANRLVQVGNWGTFQIDKIMSAQLPNPRKRKAGEMAVDNEEEPVLLEAADADQDELADLAPEDATMGGTDEMAISEAPTERRGVLLDDHHYFSDDETHLPEPPKRLPKGTSAYQAAWYLGDMSDSGSDYEEEIDAEGDHSMDLPALPQDGLEGLDQATMADPTEAGTEYPQSEMFLDPSPNEEAEQLEAYRSSRKNEANEDLEFPDEIELHPNVLARERLARYRGLKSLRTSKWETDEDRAYEPEEWPRLLQVSDFKAAKAKAVREALVGGVAAGTRVHLHLRGVPLSLQATHTPSSPLTLFSLLRHEQKRSVLNFSITLASDCAAPLRSKEALVLQCGARRMLIHPLFSQPGNTPNNVHKYERFLHPGRTAIATFTAPLTWGAVPALFFRPNNGEAADSEGKLGPGLDLVATGTAQAPDHGRVIAKRVILTGHPYKMHKRVVTVRYMFFNREDVAWFRALQLWTRRGRSGFIKEPLGTHGYFKATFDARIDPQDAVGVSLYKRVFPRPATPWTAYSDEIIEKVNTTTLP